MRLYFSTQNLIYPSNKYEVSNAVISLGNTAIFVSGWDASLTHDFTQISIPCKLYACDRTNSVIVVGNENQLNTTKMTLNKVEVIVLIHHWLFVSLSIIIVFLLLLQTFLHNSSIMSPQHFPLEILNYMFWSYVDIEQFGLISFMNESINLILLISLMEDMLVE